jgi:putative phosphoribosyl transferase
MQRIERTVVQIDAGGLKLGGALMMPQEAKGLVIFVHAMGLVPSAAPDDPVVSRVMEAGFGALLFGLLAPAEVLGGTADELRFDIPVLAQRVVSAIDWVTTWLSRGSKLGILATETAVAGALLAASRRTHVEAVVSLSGRPDLAISALARLQAPTLLIVGGDDEPGIHVNEIAAARMRSPHIVHIVEGASHRFHEPGKLDTVADLAAAWLLAQLSRQQPPAFDGGQSGVRRLELGEAVPDELPDESGSTR